MFFVAFSSLPVLVMLFYRYPMFLLCLFPVSNAIYGGIFPDYDYVTGGFVFMPSDALYFFTITTLGLCALLRPRKILAALKENIFLTMFLALMLLYVLVNTPTYGQSAIGEARKLYFMFLIPLLATVAIKTPADLRQFLVTIVWAAAGLAIFGFGTAVAAGAIFRPINAEGALTLALAAALMLIHRIHKIVLIHPLADKILLVLFSAGAITAGHRTVWLAIGSGLLLAFWLYRSKQGIVAKVLGVISIMIALIGVGIALFPETGTRFGTAFEGILNPYEDDTASWRIEGWEKHLDRLIQNGNLLFGEGLGTYYGRDHYGNLLPSPHSAYVELILKFGLFGLALYSVLVFKFVRNILAVRKKLQAGPMRAWLEASILTFGAGHAYSSGYSIEPIMLMFLAVGNSALRLSGHPAVEFQVSRGEHVPTHTTFPDVMPTRRPVRSRS